MKPFPTAPTPNESKAQLYTPRFFSDNAGRSLASARLILGYLFDLYRPTSVLDVGCGSGAWLSAAEELGSKNLFGLDGPWVDPTALLSENITFRAIDLDSDFVLRERCDLCISMEVAEHLSPNAAPRFVKNLCSASDIVVFSAAIRNQGGVMHLNEQPQSYWAHLFEEMGYNCHDVLRPVFWNDQRVEVWYRQNALLYIKASHPVSSTVRKNSTRPGPLDIVHPEIYAGNLESYKRIVDSPTLGSCGVALNKWARRQLQKLLSR
jgi:SAM-dependent methyltransferase